jgi:hypothetical protein
MVREHAAADGFATGGFEPLHPEGLAEVSATFTTDPVTSRANAWDLGAQLLEPRKRLKLGEWATAVFC